MNIAFRTDSSYTIGTGHVHRCLNIARKFKQKKNKCYFFSNEYPGNINKLIQNEFDFIKLSTKYSNDIYSDKSNLIDANLTIKLIKKLKIDLLFLDSYLIKEQWEKKVSKFCKIVFISDFLDRKSFCNYYINYNVPYENDYISKNLPIKSKKLIGSDYSIIKKLPNFKKNKNKKKITVFMGGVDTKNFTKRIVNILSNKIFRDFEKIIIVGLRNKNMNTIKEQIKKLKNFYYVLGNKKNLYSFFLNSDLVITGVGTSMYEHFALGLNSIVIAQNKLQNKIVNSLSLLNLINFIKYKQNISKSYINKVLNQKYLLDKRNTLKNLFDTRGTTRIVDYFLSKNILKKAKLKKAKYEDRFFLFKLLNDPEVIKNSLKRTSTSIESHNKWIKKNIYKKNTKIFIFKSTNHNLGQVRFDRISKNKTMITYSISNEFRKSDFGLQMLNLALKKNSFKTPVYATVKKNNIPSNKIMKKLGFLIEKKKQKDDLIYYYKKS